MADQKTPRGRFAARRIVLADGVKEQAHKARVQLSSIWRRDADAVRRKALKVERAAEKALLHGWTMAKPRLHRIEHRIEDGAKASWRTVRPRVVQIEHEMGANLLALYRRMRPNSHS